MSDQGKGNGIYVSVSTQGSDTPAMRPETDKASQSPRGRNERSVQD